MKNSKPANVKKASRQAAAKTVASRYPRRLIIFEVHNPEKNWY
jgi:hypothetical protein